LVDADTCHCDVDIHVVHADRRLPNQHLIMVGSIVSCSWQSTVGGRCS